MAAAIRIVRNRDLEAFWGVKRATEPGFMRSLINWMGGPEGHINTNPGVAVESRDCAVGIMDMGTGNRQPGVHVHTMNEIYVILEGEVESIDGVGNRHIAGRFDCLFIPKGVPHGVRTVGEADVSLLWVNDDIEKWGAAVYLEGPGPHPADDEIALVSFRDLEPDWSEAKAAGQLRWNVSWVAGDRCGPNFNPGIAAARGRIGLSLCVIEPANGIDEIPVGNQLLVVVGGEAVASADGRRETLGQRDAIFCPAGARLSLRALDRAPLYLIRLMEPAAS